MLTHSGRSMDLPVFFGDAGSSSVLHAIGAERASCVVITLDSVGANYRTVWTIKKQYPNLKMYVRAHDVEHSLSLERAGATTVVPEILEPSLQLAACILGEYRYRFSLDTEGNFVIIFRIIWASVLFLMLITLIYLVVVNT